MSKFHVSHSPESVVRAIQTMSIEEVEQQFGIEVDEDGSVWDACEGRSFDTLKEWALYMDECEEQAYEATMYRGNVRYGFDDDY